MLIKIIFSVMALILFAIALDSFLGQSEVIFSYTTKKCVKVITADGSVGDCSKLPDNYIFTWGE